MGSLVPMRSSRERLAEIVRRPDCDLAEAALLCCCEVEPDLDVEVELLRIDAIADAFVTRGFSPSSPEDDARALGAYLAGVQGFVGDGEDYHDPSNGLLTRVLDRKRGLPIALSIVYVAVGRRVGIPAYGIALPGHFVTGVGGGERPVVVDPFHSGALLDERELSERVASATGGQARFTRSMLRPAPAPLVIRRVLNNLTRDFTNQGDLEDALWTVELKQLLPGSPPDDHRARGELLLNLGRFRAAAAAFEAYVEAAPAGTSDLAEVSRRAISARAKLN